MTGSDFAHIVITFAVFGLYDKGVCHYPECKCLTKAETKGENNERK